MSMLENSASSENGIFLQIFTQNGDKVKKLFKRLVIIIVLFVLFILAFRLFGFATFKYAPNALSMLPTISPGDICLCKMKNDFQSAELENGKIVLFKHENYDYILTKRVIATERDIVEIKDGRILLNGSLLHESYLPISEQQTPVEMSENIDARTVALNKIFVMGDNRDHSLDSRNAEFGLVDITDIVGQPLIILWAKDIKKIGKRL